MGGYRAHENAHCWALIAGYSSGFHRFSDPLSQKGQFGSFTCLAVAGQLGDPGLNVADIGHARKGASNGSSFDGQAKTIRGGVQPSTPTRQATA